MKRLPSHEIKGPGGSLPLRSDDDAAVDLVMLIEGETSGRDLDTVLNQFGRSRSTYYEKLRRFREQGVEGLLSRPPGPRSPWRRPMEVVRYVVTTRLRHPDRTAGAIAADLGRMGHAVSVRSVERTLSQFGLTRPPARTATPAAANTPAPEPASADAPQATPGAPAAPPPQRAPDDGASE
ncbi:MAG TPA: helix-turn-helix domain-containing protein [Anaeromyxobacter sp.]|nr:helix-turn-helix domain-containing protein [Anaeromyxobacter sp.]